MSGPIKRILRAFKLLEVSGVDRPAQKGATVAIIKRDMPREERPTLSKADIADVVAVVVNAYADAHKVSFGKAYSEVLARPEGALAYAHYRVAPAEPVPREEEDPPIMPQEPQFTKADVADAFDKWAQSYATVNKTTLAKAYDEMLSTDMGAQLYAMSRVVEKEASPTTRGHISDAIDALAREHATAHGVSVPQAYTAILSSEAGKRLYAGMRAA